MVERDHYVIGIAEQAIFDKYFESVNADRLRKEHFNRFKFLSDMRNCQIELIQIKMPRMDKITLKRATITIQILLGST